MRDARAQLPTGCRPGWSARAAGAPLRVRRELAGERAIVSCEGELCLSTRDQAWSAIASCLALRPPVLELDLRGVSFADSRAVWLVIATASRCRRSGTALEIGASDAVAALLERVGLSWTAPQRDALRADEPPSRAPSDAPAPGITMQGNVRLARPSS